MAEVDLAKRDMYGYRETMPGEKSRVRIVAGTPIPPDLTDLEDADDLAGPDTTEFTGTAAIAQMSEEDQQAAAEEREKLITPPNTEDSAVGEEEPVARTRARARSKAKAEADE